MNVMLKPEPPKLSVVIPVYNEEACLPELIQRCRAAALTTGLSFELVLVDDGSSDRSRELIEAHSAQYPDQLIGVMLNRNYGQHAAVMAGLDNCRGEFVITLDADLQNPPEEIPRVLAKLQAGYDVVGTARAHRQDRAFRRFASALVNWMVQKTTGVLMHDYGCMLRGYRRHIVDAMRQCHERSTFIPILANTFARRTIEIEVGHQERAGGTSKYSLWKLINLQFDLLTSMTTFPLRLLSLLGTMVSFTGFGFGAFLLVMRLVFGSEWAVQGVFTLFALLFIFVGAQFIAMGLLGEYLGRIYYEVRARPRYFVDKVSGRAHAYPPVYESYCSGLPHDRMPRD
jgi:undecaprenyl-phosphate 4-deoxy-4-formamido-L-arabinose transferase